jgi:hypothetical protein
VWKPKQILLQPERQCPAPGRGPNDEVDALRRAVGQGDGDRLLVMTGGATLLRPAPATARRVWWSTELRVDSDWPATLMARLCEMVHNAPVGTNSH